MSRGDAKQCIFVDDRDRLTFLDLLGQCVTRFDWILLAYALMPNHFHLLVELTAETLSAGMQWLNGTYAIRFNNRHDRVGHVLQGRFKSPPVEKESYLLELIRYIVLNPVRANIVSRPEDYRWTSYRATAGLAPAPQWLAVHDVLLPFGPDGDLARAAFRDFVNAAIGVDSSFWNELFERHYIGSDNWMDDVREKIAVRPRSIEHPRAQRIVKPATMAEIVAAVAETCGVDSANLIGGRHRAARMIVAWFAREETLMPLREIGASLRLSYGRVSQLVHHCTREMDRDPHFRDLISTVSRKLKIKDLTPSSSS
jgi:putative transposase